MEALFKELVAHFGTQTEAGKALGVDQTTISGWVRGKHGMSPVVAMRAERVTGGKFTAAQLCPAVFGVPAESAA